MTNFLNRIAGRALGVIPLAQPLLPTRFDPAVEKSGREGSSVNCSATSSAEWHLAATQERIDPYEDKYPSHMAERFRGPTSAHALRAVSNSSLGAELSSSRPNLENEEFPPAPRFAGQRHDDTQVISTPLPALQSVPSETFRLESQRNSHGAFGSRMDDAIADPAHKIPPSPISRQSSSSAAPVVRVIIGRIDVRAELTSPPAPMTRCSRSSVLSLDQFLNQGNEAGR